MCNAMYSRRLGAVIPTCSSCATQPQPLRLYRLGVLDQHNQPPDEMSLSLP